MTKGIRLHAAIWEGDLRQCPVWTAFSSYCDFYSLTTN